jgi:hypothetical protein
VKFGGPTTFGLEIARTDNAYDPEGIQNIKHDPNPTNDSRPDKDSKANDDTKKRSTFMLGRMLERGCFNYRWPVNEYYLDLHKNHSVVQRKRNDTTDSNHITDDTADIHVGTCQMFSFAKKGIFYQILRIEEGGHLEDSEYAKKGDAEKISSSSRDFPADSKVVLTMGGPLWLRSFDAQDRLSGHSTTGEEVRSCTFFDTKQSD